MSTAQKLLRVGLGEAMRRLLDVEIRFRHGLTTPELSRERDMLLEALNRVEIELGFDCNDDGVPDSVEIFRESSETSCCRIIDLPNVRKSASKKEPVIKAKAPEPVKVVSSSRIEDPPKKPEVQAEAPPAPPAAGFFNRMFTPPKKK